MSPTFDALRLPPAAQEHGGTEVLRAAIVNGALHISLRRAFDDPQAWGMLIAGRLHQTVISPAWRPGGVREYH